MSRNPGVHLVMEAFEGYGRAQARELDRKKRERMLHQIQQIMYDRALHVPIYELKIKAGK